MNAPSPLVAGTTLLHYRLIAKIGEGGMGVVWKVVDTTLDREVAIKILPSAVAAEAEPLARFEREAKLLASLNHPNIATIHGLHEANGHRFLAMELIDGEDLAQTLARGALSVEETTRIATRVAEALEAAHDNGIVHRDLKPANVALTRDGSVKVLDFGLAKALAQDTSPTGEPQNLPTMTSAPTAAGVIMGTAGYMSPEQARGQPVDARADVWALGCLIYEMLTGTRIHRGKTFSDTIASVLRVEPDWDQIPDATPPRLVRLVRRCLSKDARQRLRHAGDVRLDLVDVSIGDDTIVGDRTTDRSSRVAIAVSAVITVLALTTAAWSWLRPVTEATDGPVRFEVRGASGDATIDDSPVAVSSDGRRLAWVATDGASKTLIVREIGSLETTDLPDTDGADNPTFSPDGNSIAFYAQGKLRRFDLGGRRSIDLCDSVEGGGISWGRDGTIVFNDGWISGLTRVSEDGGTPEPVTRLDPEDGEIGHWFPDVLPDGRHALVSRWRTGLDDISVAVASLETDEVHDVIDRASFARYLPTGQIVFVRAGAMYAIPFDLDRLRVTGHEVKVLEDVDQRWDNGISTWGVSANGILAYRPGGLWTTQRSVVRIARDGNVSPFNVKPGAYLGVTVSPDGDRLTLTEFKNGQTNVAIRDLSRGVDTELPSGAVNTYPVWSPDGSEIAFATALNGPWDIYRISVDGGSDPRPIAIDTPDQIPLAWSADGRSVVWQENYSRIRAIDPNGAGPATTIELGGSAPNGLSLSPDTRWIVYAARNSGRTEVFAQRFPEGVGSYQLSTDGGDDPIWSADGDEVFYRRGNAVVSVSVRVEGRKLVAGRPLELFRGDYVRSGDPGEWAYDRTTDTFIMIRNGEHEISRDRFVVVTHWFSDLRERLKESR